MTYCVVHNTLTDAPPHHDNKQNVVPPISPRLMKALAASLSPNGMRG
jgi:hypothetical protein